MVIFSEQTAVTKTTAEDTSELKTKGATQKEKDEDSGSDYEEDWSGDEWTDAQVGTLILRALALISTKQQCGEESRGKIQGDSWCFHCSSV